MTLLPTQGFPKWHRHRDDFNIETTSDDWIINKVSTVRQVFKFVAKIINYAPDVRDYWQRWIETYVRRMGDCEDLVILFMHYLLERGCPPEALEMQIGQIARAGTHAVLRVQVDDGYALILDNMQEHPIEERLYLRRTGFRKQAGYRLDGVINYTVKGEANG